MNQPVHYGQMGSEALAEENLVCRQIVREITNFGVSQRQLLMIMYLMAMELDDVQKVQEITAFLREVASEIFLIPQEDPNGKTDV